MQKKSDDLSKRYTDYDDLKNTGDEGERKFSEFLRLKGYTDIQNIEDIYQAEGLNLKDFDIRARNKEGALIKYEVKMQPDCDKWGMVNIEQVQNGKAAGIATSKADVWIFVNDTLGFGAISAERLKKIHYTLVKDPTVQKQAYINKERRGEMHLWMTKYRNFAAGWRMSTERLKWYQQ